MIVKATISFCGSICMANGEVRDIPEGNALSDLIRAGYVEIIEAESTATEVKQRENKRVKHK